MSDVAFAQNAMRSFVNGRSGGSLKQRLRSAATALGWSQPRAKAVLYGEARRIEAAEMEQLCRAAKIERQIREASDAHVELTQRLARMEALLASIMARVDRQSADGAQP